jgi:hypothetical protein
LFALYVLLQRVGVPRVAGFADAIRASIARLFRADDADAFLALFGVDEGKLVVAVAKRPQAHIGQVLGCAFAHGSLAVAARGALAVVTLCPDLGGKCRGERESAE